MRFRLLLVVLLTMLFVPAIALAGTRSETKAYITGLDALIVTCDEPPGNVGGVCFSLVGDELTASLSIEDNAGWTVGGFWDFRDGDDASLSAGLFCGSVEGLVVPSAATRLLVFVNGPVLGPLSCIGEGSTGNGTTGEVAVTYSTGVRPPPPTPIDVETDCLEGTPHDASISGVTDDGHGVSLDVAVLLDGVDQPTAAAAFAKAAEKSYADLDVALNVISYTSVTFTGNLASGLNAQAKAHFGGARPAGSDVVYTLTNKNITEPPIGDNVAGLADCIGGVELPDRAFAVGEISEPFNIGPTRWYVDGTAKILAHEIGHLLGGQHHYANCAEGIPTNPTTDHASVCTLMSNFADFISLNFSTLNGSIVRAHATEYAGP